MMNIQSVLWHVRDFIYPSRANCLNCKSASGQSTPWLCDACRKALKEKTVGRFPLGGVDAAAAVYLYKSPAGAMVRALKFHDVRDAAVAMGREMAQTAKEKLPGDFDAVTYVPMHKSRRRKRGFNQSELLAKSIGEALYVPCKTLLTRTRVTKQQVNLNAEMRRENLKGAFSASNVAGKRILLTDDVCTTGSTAVECAKALYDAGAASVCLIVYCREE